LDFAYDALHPAMGGLITFMLQSCQSDDKGVKLEALEFWPAFVHSHKSDKRLLMQYLNKIVPCLLSNMSYSEDEIEDIKLEEEQAKNNDPRAIKPRNYVSTRAGNSGGDGDRRDDGNTPKWTVRKASAFALDALSGCRPRGDQESAFEAELLKYLLPCVETLMNDKDWKKVEAAILALGAVGPKCHHRLSSHLPKLIQHMAGYFTNSNPLIRSITCWSISRFSQWIVSYKVQSTETNPKYLLPITQHLLQLMGDESSSTVRTAACTGFSMLTERAGDKLNPVIKPILERLGWAVGAFGPKNMPGLADSTITVLKSMGDTVRQPDNLKIIASAVIARFDKIADDDTTMFPVAECIQTMAVWPTFQPCAKHIFDRCFRIIVKVRNEVQVADKNPSAPPPDKEFLACALDLLSAVLEGLGNNAAELMKPNVQNILMAISCGANDTMASVRRASLALLGELFRQCFSHISQFVSQILPLILRNLDSKFASCCTNASWCIGELTMKSDPNVVLPYVENLVRDLGLIMSNYMPGQHVSKNVAITLGILADKLPQKVGQCIEGRVVFWGDALVWCREDEMKAKAFVGMFKVFEANSVPFLNSQGALVAFVKAICSWDQPPPQLRQQLIKALQLVKQTLQQKNNLPQFLTMCKKLPWVLQRLVQYQIITPQEFGG